MLYIKNGRTPNIVRSKLKKIVDSKEWKQINDNDIAKLREYFDNIDFKDDLRKNLCEKQHGICAYCMRKINYQDVRNVKIEHFYPISKYKGKVFDYNNYLLVCDGGTNSELNYGDKRVLCCDSSKGNKEIEISPFVKRHMEHIRYNKYGKIYYSDKSDKNYADNRNFEINNILKLNGEWSEKENRTLIDTSTNIVSKRQATYQATISYIQRLEKKGKHIMRDTIIEKINSLEKSGEYEEFIGVALFVLKRKLKQI